MIPVSQLKEFNPPNPYGPIFAIVRDCIESMGTKDTDVLLPAALEKLDADEKYRRTRTVLKNAQKWTGWGYTEYVLSAIKWVILWDFIDDNDDEGMGETNEPAST